MRTEIIVGRLVSGIGQGRHFTRLEWARRQFIDKLGIDPYPGTVNLKIDDAASLAVWSRLKTSPGVHIDNPGNGPHDCDARCYLVSIEGKFDAAIVLPDVAGYAADAIEIIAEKGIRDALGIKDGDVVRVELR